MRPNPSKFIASQLSKSPYHIQAQGCRNVTPKELTQIVEILRTSKTPGFLDRLKTLYRNAPETIEMNRLSSENQCDQFNDQCDCFLPDVTFEECWCQKERRHEK